MVEVIKREKYKARFRIQIYDLEGKKTKTISLRGHKELTLLKIYSMIVNCLEKA